jgi:hypothetical protein
MAKKMTTAEANLWGLFIVIGLLIYGISQLFETIGWVTPALAIVGIIAFIAWQKHAKKQKRLSYLREKYQDEDIVQKIFNGYFWQGQTGEQLLDALGAPIEIDRKVLKTKSKEVWKYQHQGAKRFGLRITVENGYVEGWEQKA